MTDGVTGGVTKKVMWRDGGVTKTVMAVTKTVMAVTKTVMICAYKMSVI